MIGVSVSTLQNWERGRRRVEDPARALLKIPELRTFLTLEYVPELFTDKPR